MCSLKEKLLQEDFVIDNEYLDLYVDLIVHNIDRVYSKGLTNLHHIIPKYVFVRKKVSIDSTKSNLVYLEYAEHIKAHYYLAKCSKYGEDISKNALSIRFILKGYNLLDFNIESIDCNYLNEIYRQANEEFILRTHTDSINKQISNKLLGRVSPNKGKYFAECSNKKSHKNPNAKNKKLSDIASARIGEKNSFYGKKHSEATKQAIGEKNHKYSVAMLDYTTKEVLKVFSHCKYAEAYIYEQGISKSKTSIGNRILRVCKTNDLHYKAYGYSWKFVDKV